MGCSVAWKCFVARRFLLETQQPASARRGVEPSGGSWGSSPEGRGLESRRLPRVILGADGRVLGRCGEKMENSGTAAEA